MIFHQLDSNGLIYYYTEFQVAHIAYFMIFCADPDTLAFYQEDEQIGRIIHNHIFYSVKFVVKDYILTGNDDLYAPPLEHRFGKSEILALRHQLERILFSHYQQFKPDGYLFVAEHPSLSRMYQKMCSKPSRDMLAFKYLAGLGDNKDCFIIQSPAE